MTAADEPVAPFLLPLLPGLRRFREPEARLEGADDIVSQPGICREPPTRAG